MSNILQFKKSINNEVHFLVFFFFHHILQHRIRVVKLWNYLAGMVKRNSPGQRNGGGPCQAKEKGNPEVSFLLTLLWRGGPSNKAVCLQQE